MNLQIKNIATKTLLIFISISFILFGIINYFTSLSETNILKINNKQIGMSVFMNFLSQKRMQLYKDENDTINYLNSPSFVDEVLRLFVAESLLENELNELSFNEPRELLLLDIYNSDVFKDKSGKFNIDIYRGQLEQNSLSEDEYISYLSSYFSKLNLGQILAGHNLSNNFITEKLIKDANIYYIADVYTMDDLLFEKVDFKQEDIEKYYNKNASLFRIPERKEYSYIDIDMSTYNADEIKEKVSQLEDLILSSKNIDDIANVFNVKKQLTETPQDVDADFLQYDEGVFSDLIYKNNNVYKIYFVEKVVPSKLLSIDEAKEQIINLLEKEHNIENGEKNVNNIIRQMKTQKKTDMILFRNNIKLKKNVSIYKNNTNYSDIVLKRLFKTKKANEYTEPSFDEDNKVWTFMFVKEIKEETDSKTIDPATIHNQITFSYANSINDIYQQYLLKKSKIIINKKLLDSLYENN
jgi:hypothetical protein